MLTRAATRVRSSSRVDGGSPPCGSPACEHMGIAATVANDVPALEASLTAEIARTDTQPFPHRVSRSLKLRFESHSRNERWMSATWSCGC